MSPNRRSFLRLVLASIAVIAASTYLLSLFEHISYSEGLYRSIYIVLSHHDNFHMDDVGSRVVIIALIVLSLIVIAYLLKTLADYMINLGDGLKRNKMKAKLVNAKDHYIVCGLGSVGMNIAKELSLEKVKFVGIDKDENLVKDAIARGFTAFVGDGTKEEVLHRAKIDKARGLVAALGDDSSNLFVTLTSRQINPHLYIVTRANHSENVSRIEKAGADKVAMPNQIGGFHMATMLIRPGVVDFMEILSAKSNSELEVEEVIIPKHSVVVGMRLKQFLHTASTSATVLALNSVDGTSKVNPSGDEILYSGDKLILMGTRSQLDTLSQQL